MAAQHTKRTRRSVIAAYSELGRVDLACQKAGVPKSLHYRWLHLDPTYKAEFEAARERMVGMLEDEAFRRAIDGSDKMLEILLKANAPEKYRERYNITGNFNIATVVQSILKGAEAAESDAGTETSPD